MVFICPERRKETELLLPESYNSEKQRALTSNQQKVCECRWCKLAKLSGPAFLLWQKSKKGKGKQPLRRLCTQCFIGVEIGKSHTCSASTLVAVENLVESLPEDVRAKLAHQYLASKMESAGDSQPLFLLPAGGGHPDPVLVGKKDVPT